MLSSSILGMLHGTLQCTVDCQGLEARPRNLNQHIPTYETLLARPRELTRPHILLLRKGHMAVPHGEHQLLGNGSCSCQLLSCGHWDAARLPEQRGRGWNGPEKRWL